jgi:branched-chain amino acid transport system ATP-binding protein
VKSMNKSGEILCVTALKVAYGSRRVLDGIDFSLPEREIRCVIGEEGSGKTTLLKAITRQLTSEGIIFFNGEDLRKVPTHRFVENRIDFLMQGGNILRSFTVQEHIDLALSLANETERESRWQEIANTFPSVMDLRKQVGGRLSGGERLILSLACIIATDADLIMLDEPTSGLAYEMCDVLKDFLLRLKNESNKTIFLLEHNYEFAFGIADFIYVLKDGMLTDAFAKDAFLSPHFVEDRMY